MMMMAFWLLGALLLCAWLRERRRRALAERALAAESRLSDSALAVARAFQTVGRDAQRTENARLLAAQNTRAAVPVLSEEEIRERELLNVLNYDGTEAGQLGFDE